MIFHVENHYSEIGRAVSGSRGACVFGNVSWKVNSNLYFQDVWRVSGHWGQRLGGPLAPWCGILLTQLPWPSLLGVVRTSSDLHDRLREGPLVSTKAPLVSQPYVKLWGPSGLPPVPYTLSEHNWSPSSGWLCWEAL